MKKNQVTALFKKNTLRHIVFSTFLEFGPVLLFLASFERKSIYESTVILMVGTIISTIVTYHLQKRIPYLALYVAFITIVFGYMTIHFHEVKFIQMRDTLYDITCAVTLMLGFAFNIRFLKIAFHEVIPMTNRAWDKLTHRWIFYFIINALCNEFVRRFLPLEEWFIFKSSFVVIACIFGLCALYYSYETEGEEVITV